VLAICNRRGHIRTILCIDHQLTLLELHRRVLQNAGYRVFTAQSGVEALALFQTEPVDLVVLEFLMPELNGGRLAAGLKQMKPDVPIIMYSSVYPPANVLAAVDLFISKTANIKDVVAQVECLLGD
jgi:DNA-binding response OmpR family regulator